MPRKTQETRRNYKVFIASPGDVTVERSVAFDVIADLNRIYEGQRHDYRLEVRVWEKHTHPDLGLPQEVINQQISIRECDIFIGVFWKRFGTPPGSACPNDGRPYLSGTEEEIGIAIEARNTSPNQRPVIMLYQKVDPLPTNMEEDDHLQYAEILKLFKQCESGGEHPALVAKFSGDQFHDVLRDHLLKVVAGFESQARSVSVKEPDVSIPRPSNFMLRARLEKLDSVEIEALCLDHFTEVYDKFSRGLRRDEMINLLLGHCHRNPEEARRLDGLLPSGTEDGAGGLRLVSSLGQLREPGPQFDVPIDQSLVQLAEGSPRATIWLANRLIELHGQPAVPPRFIQLPTWEQVKAEWQNSGRSQLFGSPTQSEGFVLVGERIYFQGKEINLSKKFSALLRCLIRAGERGCSKEDLIRAGWPGDQPEGVTDATLLEAVRRMKVELKKLGGDSRWVKTVRGRGYRLQKP